MKKIIKLTESDLENIIKRVLNKQLHESSTKRQYLPEQVNTTHDKVYDYKKEGDKYYYRKKGEETFKKVATGGKSEQQIKIKVFNEKPSTTKVNSTTMKSKNGLPFKSKEEGDKFRRWMNRYYPKISKNIDLDKSGSFNNSYIQKAWNASVNNNVSKKFGVSTLGDLYNKQVLSKGRKKNPVSTTKGDIFVSDTISPVFKNQIDFNNLSVGGTTNKICKPGSDQCAQFVNDFTDKFDIVGDAWTAYRLDSKLGSTISSKFKGLDTTNQEKAIKLWLKIHENGGGKEDGTYKDEAKEFIGSLVGGGLETNLKIDDIVGIYHEPSSHHEEAFYEGGQGWFKDVNGKKVPGTTIRKGDGWGMNTHVGIVGVEKNGVPLIFHNVGGNVKSDPADNLKIAWVKRKGGTKSVKV